MNAESGYFTVKIAIYETKITIAAKDLARFTKENTF